MDSYWFELWLSDKRSILAAMLNNLSADLLAGYDPAGRNVHRQIDRIAAYRLEIEEQADHLRMISPEAAAKWCRADLKKRGAIA